MKRLLILLVLAFALGSLQVFGCGIPGEPSNCGDEVMEVSDKTDRIVEEFEHDIRMGRLNERSSFALNAIVRFAIFKLRAKGHKFEANKLEREWNGWSHMLLSARDLGDHRPLSQWLADKYAVLELILGVKIMEITRLVDIKKFNFGVPVVFSCVDNVDEVEFSKHWIPLADVTIYWGSFFSCVGATWGSGFLFCGPISMGCEFVTDKWVAPKLNPTVWKWSCQ